MSLAPPRPKGPHLNALRAFEASARLGGFAAAAEELCVTPGAVSQQVKALEEWVGTPLFERRSKGVTLTPLAERVIGDFTTAFDMLSFAKRKLLADTKHQSISIAALPSIAQLWLSPRLRTIRSALPDYAISVTALEHAPNLNREMFDLSLFLREPSGAGNEQVLAEDVMFPVCAPAIAERISCIEDLQKETFLHDATWHSDWLTWLEQNGHANIKAKEHSTFSLYGIALDEARNGVGVLIGHVVLVEPELLTGALVAPFKEKCATGKALVLESLSPLSSGTKTVLDILNSDR